MSKDGSTRGGVTDHLLSAAEQFLPDGGINIREFGSGNVNDTFLLSPDSRAGEPVILQRINTRVFQRPELIMQNLGVFSRHVWRRLKREPVQGRRWEIPRILPAKDCRDYWVDPAGNFWRAMSFIGNADSFDVIRSEAHAGEIGLALGLFHSLVSDLPPDSLADTLAGFHIAPAYLRRYEVLLQNRTAPPSLPGVKYCLNFVRSRGGLAHILEDARGGGLPVRTIHGDPKVSNVMIDRITGQAVGIVDLDTVKPGLIHYDIGDCLRSCCNPLGEEIENPEQARFDVSLCRAVLQGYISMAASFLTERDYDFVYDSIRVIAFELGLRFFTDYLEGNVYFKVNHPEHNLQRALVQFRLVESVEAEERSIRKIVQDAR